MLSKSEGTHIDAKVSVPCLKIHFGDIAVRTSDANNVDQYVQLAEQFDCFFDRSLAGVFMGDIALDDFGDTALFVNDGFRFLSPFFVIVD